MYNIKRRGRGALAVGSLANTPSHVRCAHCSRTMNNFAGGSSRGYNGENLCNPNAKNRPNCYALVTRYNHETPCLSKECYEDHAELLTYVDAHPRAKKKTNRKRKVNAPELLEDVA